MYVMLQLRQDIVMVCGIAKPARQMLPVSNNERSMRERKTQQSAESARDRQKNNRESLPSYTHPSYCCADNSRVSPITNTKNLEHAPKDDAADAAQQEPRTARIVTS